MKRAMEKAASGPSGLLIYHPSREFTFGKLLGIEFATELLEAILVVFLLTQTKIESFAGRVGFVFTRWNSCCDHHEHSLLELVWLPFQIHRCLHVY